MCSCGCVFQQPPHRHLEVVIFEQSELVAALRQEVFTLRQEVTAGTRAPASLPSATVLAVEPAHTGSEVTRADARRHIAKATAQHGGTTEAKRGLEAQIEQATVHLTREYARKNEAVQAAMRKKDEVVAELRKGVGASQQALASSQAELERAHSELTQTQAELKQTQAELKQTQAELKRTPRRVQADMRKKDEVVAELRKGAGASQRALASSQAELKQAQAELKQAQAALKQAQAALKQAQAALKQKHGELKQVPDLAMNGKKERTKRGAAGRRVVGDAGNERDDDILLEEAQVKADEERSQARVAVLERLIPEIQHAKTRSAVLEQWGTAQTKALLDVANFAAIGEPHQSHSIEVSSIPPRTRELMIHMRASLNMYELALTKLQGDTRRSQEPGQHPGGDGIKPEWIVKRLLTKLHWFVQEYKCMSRALRGAAVVHCPYQMDTVARMMQCAVHHLCKLVSVSRAAVALCVGARTACDGAAVPDFTAAVYAAWESLLPSEEGDVTAVDGRMAVLKRLAVLQSCSTCPRVWDDLEDAVGFMAKWDAKHWRRLLLVGQGHVRRVVSIALAGVPDPIIKFVQPVLHDLFFIACAADKDIGPVMRRVHAHVARGSLQVLDPDGTVDGVDVSLEVIRSNNWASRGYCSDCGDTRHRSGECTLECTLECVTSAAATETTETTCDEKAEMARKTVNEEGPQAAGSENAGVGGSEARASEDLERAFLPMTHDGVSLGVSFIQGIYPCAPQSTASLWAVQHQHELVTGSIDKDIAHSRRVVRHMFATATKGRRITELSYAGMRTSTTDVSHAGTPAAAS